MLLCELFDSTFNLEVVSSASREFEVQCHVGKKKMVFAAHLEGELHRWSVGFYEEDEGGSLNWLKTGTGKEFQVFGFVKQAFEMFIDKYRPEHLEFAVDKAEHRGRISIYEKFFKRLGYDVKKILRPAAHHFIYYDLKAT